MLLLATACLEKPEIDPSQSEQEGLASSFDFKTTQGTVVDMTFEDNEGQPFGGIKVQVWDVNDEDKGNLIFTAFTSDNGTVYQEIELATALSSVIIETNHIGVPNNLEVPVENG